MKMYRRFRLWSDLTRIMVSLMVTVIFLLCCKGSHDYYVHPTAEKQRRDVSLAERWNSFPRATNKNALIERGKLARLISYNIDGVAIYISSENKPLPTARDKEIRTWLAPNEPHVWVYTCVDKGQVHIAIPQHKPIVHWLHTFEQARYESFLLLVPIPEFPLLESIQPIAFTSGDELADVAIAYISRSSKPFNERMNAIANQSTWLRDFDRFMESSTAHGLVMCIAAVALCLGMLPRGLQQFSLDVAEDHGLDETAQQRIYAAMLEYWLTGMAIDRIRHRANMFAKKLRREQDRAEDRKRRETIRKLTDEARAKKLAEQAEKQAKQARERLLTGQSTLGKEVVAYRKVIKDEGSDVAAMLEDGFVYSVTKRGRNNQVSGEGSLADLETNEARLEAEQAILSCSQRLEPLDRFTDSQLVLLATHLRSVKRKLGRGQWRNLCDRFDPDEPESFIKFVINLDKHGEAQFKPTATASGRLMTVKDAAESADVPKLLDRKKVILVGGDPGLSGFYERQIERLGATVLLHQTNSNTLRMRDTKPDLILILWRRTDHKAQQTARSMGVQIVFLDKLSKSSFLSSGINDIREQLGL